MLKKISSLLLHLVLFALVCAIAAYWVVKIVTPPPAAAPPPVAAPAPREADPVLAAKMFGLVQAAPAQMSNVQVLGLFAAGKQSSAVLAVDGKAPRVFLIGQQVSPGTRLVAVTRDVAVLENAGARQEARAPARPAVSFGGPAPAPGFVRDGNELSAPSLGGPAPRQGVPVQPGFAPQFQPQGQQPFQPQPAPPPQDQLPVPPQAPQPQTQ